MESRGEIKVGRHKKNRQMHSMGNFGIALRLRINPNQQSRYIYIYIYIYIYAMCFFEFVI
jgi:hypothetical protein